MSSEVEVCIVSYASAKYLSVCLASISATIGDDTRVAVREHHLDAVDDTGEVVGQSGLPSRVEHDPTNPGFAAGCNALAVSSEAPWLLFLNADTEIVSWPFATMPPSAILGPLMVDSGHPGRHYGRRYRVRDEIRRSWLRRYDPPPEGTGFVSGAALLIPRQRFVDLGGFDERYFMYYEDIDLCLRANGAGLPTLLEPQWTVRHSGGHSTTQNRSLALLRSFDSAVEFHGVHQHPVVAYRAYVTIDAGLRAGLHAVRRDRAGARAYLDLLRQAIRPAAQRDNHPDR